ncbi:MAG: cytochrome c [Planctomycetes bacterium]|nr:cytochrome c [Planctomycetota bacterium]
MRLSNLIAVALLGAFAACRGGISDQPPVHLVLDMDFQPKLKAQSESHFEGWSDHRGMRVPPMDANGRTAVVARGAMPRPELNNRDASNAFVTSNPVAATAEVLARGRKLFDINCAVCHGYTGQGGNDPQKGHGLVGRRWPVAIPNFHFVEGADNRVASLAEGEYFEVITNGKGTMPAYGARIAVEDRWAVVHYIRALQNLSK